MTTLIPNEAIVANVVIRIGRRGHLYVKEWRERFGLTQEDIAGRLNVTKGTISRWESQPHRFGPEKMAAYAEALDIEPEQFWHPPERPSIDALLKDVSPELIETAIDVVKRIIWRKAS